MHSAKQPPQAECDANGRIGLIFNGVTECPLKRASGLSRGIRGCVGHLGGGIRNFIGNASGVFFGISQSTVEIGAGGLRHPGYSWIISLNFGLLHFNALS
jgi:hypothetical protein